MQLADDGTGRPESPPANATRLEREAEALRANLRRRKQQAQARKSADPDPVPPADDTTGT